MLKHAALLLGLFAQAAPPAATPPPATPPPAAPAPAAPALAPGEVRPVPPKGITIPEADRRQLEAELSTLAQEMKRLRARPELAAHLPDVEIFYRAVDGAFRHGEFFAVEEIAKAKQLLETGRARARALGSGKTPWMDSPGPRALGYVSRIDGSVQPYGLTIPDGYRPRGGRRWRLDAWFHGRGEKLSEVNFVDGVSRKPGDFAGPEALFLQPYGRYCNGSKLAGEVDFFEALADVKRRFPVDEDRVVIRGFSLGGHSAWHLGAHFAADWAVVAPGAGFSESPEFLRFFEKDKLEATWWQEKLWQLYDAPAYAENFRNVPVIAYSGEKDKQKQAADLMATVLSKVGVELVHVIGAGTGHSYHPDAKVRINQLVDTLAARGRDPLPRRVSLTTATLKYNRQAWLQVDGLGQHWEKARADGQLGDGEVTVKTSNVTALSLQLPSGRTPFFPGQSPRVILDGQRLSGPATVRSDRSWAASFHKVGGRWKVGALPDDGPALRKRHGLQGPIDDAFTDAFIFVVPSGKSPGDVAAWVTAEQGRAISEWRRQFRGEPQVRQDRMLTDEEIAGNNLVLWGDPQSNLVLARIMEKMPEKLPFRWTKEAVVVGKQSFPADRHALIAVYPNPLNPRRYLVLNSGFTFREYDYLNNARQTPKLPDWAVIDVTTKPDARWPGKVAAADFFGERWEVKPARARQRGATAGGDSTRPSPL